MMYDDEKADVARVLTLAEGRCRSFWGQMTIDSARRHLKDRRHLPDRLWEKLQELAAR